MKNYILLFCLIVENCSFGQYSNDINAFRKETTGSIHLPKQYKQETRQTKIRFLKKMYNDTSSIVCSGKLYTENFADYRKRYDTTLYVHDFDADGDYDILFYGRLCPGLENTDVVIFFKKGKKYIPQRLGNRIVKMDLSKRSTELAVLKTPCCSDYQLEFMYYKNVNGLEDSVRQYTHQIFGFDYFKNPPAGIDTLITITSGQEVVMAPDLNMEDYNQYLENDENPVIGTLIPGISLKAYNTFFDGRKTWYYIIVNVNSEIILNQEWNNNWFGEIKSARGWISSDE